MNTNVPIGTQPADHRKRNIGLIVGILAALVVCCCLLVAAALIANWQWHLLDRLSGSYDPVAAAMPADTSLFVSANLLSARSDKTSKLVTVLTSEVKDSTVKDLDSLIDELDKNLDDQLHLTFSKDILPWIGQYAGIGLLSLELDRYGSPENTKWIAALEARDQKAADAFLAKFQKAVTDSSGDTFKQTKYNGVTIYEVESQQGALARSGGLVLIGPDAESVQKAIDAQKGKSLAKSPAYGAMLKQLPRERTLTFYASGEQIEKLVANLSQAGGMGLGGTATASQLTGLRASAATLSVVDAGVQVDSFTSYDLDKLSDDQKKMLKIAGVRPKTADLFPESTFVYLASQRLDLVWNVYRETLNQSVGQTDIQEAMNMFEKQYGLNPDKALFPYLDGEWAIGMMPSSKGYLAVTSKTPLGFAALFETSNASALQTTLTTLNGKLKQQRMPVTESSSGGVVMYELQDPSSKSTMLAYGTNKNYLYLGSDPDTVKEVLAGSKPLSKSDRYQQVSRAFPSGMTLAMYVDLEKLLETIRKSLPASGVKSFDEGVKYIKPVKFIAMGNSPPQGDTYRSTMIVFIPTK